MRGMGRLLTAALLAAALTACGGGSGGAASATGGGLGSGQAAKSGASSATMQALAADTAAPFEARIVDDRRDQARPPVPAWLDQAHSIGGVRVYQVFSTNGNQATLTLDFDRLRYKFAPRFMGAPTEGSFAPDATQRGTFAFVSSGETGSPIALLNSNVSKFRLAGDAITGIYTLPDVLGFGPAYPFLGVSTLHTSQAQLDGTYNRLGVGSNWSLYTFHSYAQQIRISEGGTRLFVCQSNAVVYRVDNCPQEYAQSYTIAPGSRPGVWILPGVQVRNEQMEFSVARINGENVFLAAGFIPGTLEGHFRIGFAETTRWPTATVYGGIVSLELTDKHPPFVQPVAWVGTTIDGDAITQSVLGTYGGWDVARAAVLPMTGTAPLGLRKIGASPTERVVAAQGAGLWASVNLASQHPADPDSSGLFGLAITGTAPVSDPRNGSYTAFSANGTKQTLKLDFDTRRYEMTDAAGRRAVGGITSDPARPGSYAFVSDQFPEAAGIARFQVSIDAVVGAFPFASANNPSVAAVQPFIAVRRLISDFAELDRSGYVGAYNRFGVTRNNATGAVDSTVQSFTIRGGAAELMVCKAGDWGCNFSGDTTYALTRGPEPGSWVGTNKANPADRRFFHVARIGTTNIYLNAQTTGSPPLSTFEVGLQSSASDWPGSGQFATPVTGLASASTLPSYGLSELSGLALKTAFTRADGSTGALDIALEPLNAQPTARPHMVGIRIGTNAAAPADEYDVMNRLGLTVLLGRPGNPNTQGFMQLTTNLVTLRDPAP